MACLNLLPVGKTVQLGHSIKPDGIVIFRSAQLNMSTVSYANLNLLSDNGDVVLHIGFRPIEEVIVFNACRSGNWLIEERIPFGENRLRGHNHTVIIYDHGDNYQILFNGKTGHYFKKQLMAEACSLQYQANTGQDSLFSDPIVAETYTNWAALVAGLN